MNEKESDELLCCGSVARYGPQSVGNQRLIQLIGDVGRRL